MQHLTETCPFSPYLINRHLLFVFLSSNQMENWRTQYLSLINISTDFHDHEEKTNLPVMTEAITFSYR